MEKKEFVIGFITGRPNVCNIINTYYKTILNQLGESANLNFYILYDLNYNHTTKEEFYNINKEVYESGVKIRHIGIEEMDLEKEIVQEQYNLSEAEVNLFMGYGYCRARNTIMYYALKNNVDYLLFWDDDEYPVACLKENNKISWIEQENIKEHMKYIQKSNITFGYRCGYNSPVPYIDFNKYISEIDFKNFIDAVSNEAVSWKNIRNNMEENGITYAQKAIIEEKKIKRLYRLGIDEWLLGSGICINITDIEKIPAFYNPPNARGEDAFFSTLLGTAKVYKIPTYHFHDGFLQYTQIMEKKYPDKLKKVEIEEKNIRKRFIDAAIGWIKYKPLLLYITHRQQYTQTIAKTYEQLKLSIPKMNEAFNCNDFSELLVELEKYDTNVHKHYWEYIKINNIWNKIKTKGRERLYA